MGVARIFSGFRIAMDAHGNIAPGVFFVDPQDARDELSRRLARPWDDLERDGWKLVSIEGWSLI